MRQLIKYSGRRAPTSAVTAARCTRFLYPYGIVLLSLATVVVAVAAHPATRIVVSWDGALGARIRKTRGARSRGLPGRGGGGMLPPIAD